MTCFIINIVDPKKQFAKKSAQGGKTRPFGICYAWVDIKDVSYKAYSFRFVGI